ncbi:ABC transporter G family member 36 [Rhynchospora pubera]|uniref:ABC transporter G family member 36 n=1 Tax=Rhynchospora pubera TaxID=906938 RepID=A0AAV8D8S3_9POAL|nr:ABC transporter G family member 36 [Rhynchospora pubera]
MLEVTALAQERNLGVDFGEIYKKSDLYQRNKRLIKELSTLAPDSNDLNFTTQFSQPFLVQCQACLWKQNLSYWRNPSYTAIRQFFTTVMALFFGSAFWDLGGKRKKQQDLFNSLGSMYVSVGIEIPYIFVQSLVYGCIVYAMVGFEWTLTKFFWYWFFMYFTFLYYTFYGMMLVGLTPNYAVASIISSAFNSLWNLFSGYLIPRTKIPIWWRWFYWTCPVSWTLYGLVASQFGDLEDELDNGETIKEFIRSYFGFKESLIHGVAMVVVGFSVLFLLLFAYSIKRFNFQKR